MLMNIILYAAEDFRPLKGSDDSAFQAQTTRPEVSPKSVKLKCLNWQLLLATIQGNLSDIRSALNSGADVNYLHMQKEFTPLIAATIKGNDDAVILLLKNRADVCVKNKEEKTALYYASLFERRNILDMLLAKTRTDEACEEPVDMVMPIEREEIQKELNETRDIEIAKLIMEMSSDQVKEREKITRRMIVTEEALLGTFPEKKPGSAGGMMSYGSAAVGNALSYAYGVGSSVYSYTASLFYSESQ